MLKCDTPVRVSDPHYRESRVQDVDAYVAKGKIPVDVDLSQHPEKSIEARRCTFPMSFTAPDCRIHFTCRAYGKGCRIHKRCKDRSGDVSRLVSHHCGRLKLGNAVWMNS